MSLWTKTRNALVLSVRSVFRDATRFDFHGREVVVPRSIPNDVKFAVLRGKYEAAEVTVVRRYLNPGDCVIELGGSLGLVSAVVRSCIGPDALHLVVEANPAVLDTLARNAGLSDRTVVIGGIIAPDEGSPTAQFYADNNTLAGSAFRDDGPHAAAAVERITIRDVIDTFGIDEFTIVCDIEGAELDVVRELEDNGGFGCSTIIAEVHPDILARRGVGIDAFLDLVAKVGFEPIDRIGDVHVWRRAPAV